MTQTAGPVQLGSLIDERHQTDEVVGVGGFATVYLGTDTGSGRRVAIKVLNRAQMAQRARFSREIEAVSQLRDPHTVRLFSHGEAPNGAPFIVFEYVPGRDLGDVIAEEGPLPADIVEHVLRQVLASLREAHHHGVLHRDIKPANIRVFEHDGDPWTVKVLDFGIARFEAERDVKLTKTGELLGTPRYMSPEQLLSQPLGPASDIYGVGMVALEMLVGRDNMHGSRWSDQLDRLRSGHLFAVEGEQAQLNAVLARMTARRPEDRFQSVDAVLTALDQTPAPQTRDSAPLFNADSAPVPAPDTGPQPASIAPPPSAQPSPPGSTASVATTADRRAKIATLAGAIAVLLLLVVGAAFFLQQPAEPQATPEPRRNVSGLLATSNPSRPAKPDTEPTTTSGATAATAEPSPRPWDAPVLPLDQKTPGCGKVPTWSKTAYFAVFEEHGFSERERRFGIYLPRDYDENQRYPVLLLFPTVVLNSADLLTAIDGHNFADRHGVILLTFSRQNELDAYTGEDAPYVEQALRTASEEVCLDPGRIFAFGHGKGGLMARELACRMPLTGIATSGDWTIRAIKCHESRPVPYIKFSGLDDPYAPMQGGPNCLGEGPILPVETIENAWRENNSCAGESSSWKRRRDGACKTWECDASFVSCQIDGGHFFPEHRFAPPDPPFFDCPTPAPTFPIIDTVWEFFEQQPPLTESGG